METDSPPLSVELIPRSCTGYPRVPACPPLPSTTTPSDLGRSEESEEAPERDGVLESESQGCGFKPCLCPFWSVRSWINDSASGSLSLNPLNGDKVLSPYRVVAGGGGQTPSGGEKCSVSFESLECDLT